MIEKSQYKHNICHHRHVFNRRAAESGLCRHHFLYLMLVSRGLPIARVPEERDLSSRENHDFAYTRRTCDLNGARNVAKPGGSARSTCSWQAVRRENFRFRNFRRLRLGERSGDACLGRCDPHNNHDGPDNTSGPLSNTICGRPSHSCPEIQTALYASAT